MSAAAGDDLRVHEDTAALVADAAAWFLDRVAAAQRDGRVAHVALTGGSLAPHLHRAIAARAPRSGADLSRVDWWWGDERFVAEGSDERNDATGLDDLLVPLEVPAERIHRVPSSDEVGTVEEAADRYAADLRAAEVEFEVVILGLGPDGHVASLFPGHAGLTVTGVPATAVHDSPKPPPQRVSLTYEALRRNRAVLFVATGEGKAEAVRAARSVGDVDECPARGVRGSEETLWCLDRGAASLLP